MVPHEDYDYWSGAGFYNDIALIEILDPFDSNLVVPVKILSPDEEAQYASTGTLAVIFQ